ncbi:hypothetical protein Fmac_021448 [Flemingia macrophylla]|uniref:Secreted protein n=1 Tax=Flemingia macrophylla TaxID=520843 RepID=A0ABD1LX00_9FABA
MSLSWVWSAAITTPIPYKSSSTTQIYNSQSTTLATHRVIIHRHEDSHSHSHHAMQCNLILHVWGTHQHSLSTQQHSLIGR